MKEKDIKEFVGSYTLLDQEDEFNHIVIPGNEVQQKQPVQQDIEYLFIEAPRLESELNMPDTYKEVIEDDFSSADKIAA